MPSNKILEQKKQVVEELAAKIQSAAAGVLVKYEGITVAEDTELRAALRKAGVEYTVMKNTLTGRACDIAGYGEMKQYADKIGSFEIKAGFVDGGVLDQAGVIELAEIPSKEVLIGKVMGSLQSSLYGFAFVLQAIIDKDGEAAPAEEAAAEA